MQDDDSRGVLRQRQRFLQGGVSPADDADDAAAEQRRVAAGAVADALAAQLFFSGNAERFEAVPVAITIARARTSPSPVVTRHRSSAASRPVAWRAEKVAPAAGACS